MSTKGSPRQKKERQLAELYVSGYLRIECTSSNDDVPYDLINLCLFMYFMTSDEWNLNNSAIGLEYDAINNMISRSSNDAYPKWKNAFGKIIITRGGYKDMED